ncbi:hypothetical protein GH714_039753 [Hevea brasiliensis]|uniref:Uncharacterized protein n=1 Tax=Hevea brasiliensis TaxID=3981 RepID=A0A6A6KEZ8_HEVBR|nr:hypothetical protein GH714_039753 [Hevea brasiliensis]
MGKSFSGKRKRSKYSSQGRTKKRSKTKRSRSKKLRRQDGSVSYSRDDSRSPLSISSSSEDTYLGRRSQSRSFTRKDVKGTKRRARSYSCSSGSEESCCLRKQKGSRRNDDSKARKKKTRNKKKKKSRRNASNSSRSSGSWSCSTCRSSSSSSDESEYENHRGRSERRDNDTRKLKKVKSGTKRSRYRSRSCSSCSRHNENSDYRSEEKVTGGNISKRLRSIITLTKEDEERKDLDWDEHKEEIIYDHDDYPSSKSNDSNDGGNKMVSAHQSHVAFDKIRPIETEEREDTSVLNIKTTKLIDSHEEGDGHYVGSKPAWEGQKALENLRRFRGGFLANAMSAANQKDTSDGTLKSPSSTKAELSEIESPKDDGARDKRNIANSMQKDEKIVDGKNGHNEFVPAKNNAHLPNQEGVASNEKVRMSFGSGFNKPRLVRSALKRALSNATTAAVEMPASQVSNKAKLVNLSRVGKHVSGNDKSDKVNNASSVASAKSSSCLVPIGEDVGLNKLQDEGKEVAQLENKAESSVTPLNSSGHGGTVNNASSSTSAEPSSHLTSAATDKSSDKVQDDYKDGSQLERKTMSVMRGGEMVQARVDLSKGLLQAGSDLELENLELAVQFSFKEADCRSSESRF